MTFQTTRLLEKAGARIAYGVVEPAELTGPTICLIASTGRGPEDFAHLAEALAARGFLVLLPWPRGSHASTGPMEDIDFHDLAADAAAVIEAEPHPNGCIAAGHAYGCWIARTLTQDRPDLIDKLVLIAAGGGKWPEELSQAINIAMSPDEPEEARLAALRLAFFAGDNDPRPYLTGWNSDLVRKQRAARGRTERDSWWSSGTAPILDLIGLQDPFRPADARDFYVREFPGRVTLVAIEGASHALPDELPEQVAREIASWCAARP